MCGLVRAMEASTVRRLICATGFGAGGNRGGGLLITPRAALRDWSDKFLSPLQLDLRERLRRPAAFERALGLLYRCFEQALFDPVEWLAFRDRIALPEQYGIEDTPRARSLRSSNGLSVTTMNAALDCE